MTRPQSSELRRNGLNPALEPEATAALRAPSTAAGTDGPDRTIPEDNRPGHHPDHEQDRPDPADFLERSHRRALDVASAESDEDRDRDIHEPAADAATSDRSITPVLQVAASAVHGLGGTVARIRRWTAMPLRRAADVIDPVNARSSKQRRLPDR